jgi:hypothetical protein
MNQIQQAAIGISSVSATLSKLQAHDEHNSNENICYSTLK